MSQIELDRSDPEGAIADVVHKVSNWGRWGDDDVRGTLNYISRRSGASQLV